MMSQWMLKILTKKINFKKFERKLNDVKAADGLLATQMVVFLRYLSIFKRNKNAFNKLCD